MGPLSPKACRAPKACREQGRGPGRAPCPALTSRLAAAGPGPWSTVLPGRGWRVSPGQAWAEFASHSAPATRCLCCGPGSPQEPPLGRPHPCVFHLEEAPPLGSLGPLLAHTSSSPPPSCTALWGSAQPWMLGLQESTDSGGFEDFLHVISWCRAAVGHQRAPLQQRQGPWPGSATKGPWELGE